MSVGACILPRICGCGCVASSDPRASRLKAQPRVLSRLGPSRESSPGGNCPCHFVCEPSNPHLLLFRLPSATSRSSGPLPFPSRTLSLPSPHHDGGPPSVGLLRPSLGERPCRVLPTPRAAAPQRRRHHVLLLFLVFACLPGIFASRPAWRASRTSRQEDVPLALVLRRRALAPVPADSARGRAPAGRRDGRARRRTGSPLARACR